ncbi:MAG: Integral membrane sensor signal transduction histidine kinase, partial [Candidatus Gottesmanbacteria bacterium GW2011_GWA2_42_18]
MNYRSIKFRLTLWYTLAFLLAATIIFAGFFWLTGQVLFQQTDSSLISHGNKVVEVVAKQGRDMHEIFAQRAFIYEFSEIPGMLVIIMNPEGDIISSSLMNSFDRNSFAVMHRDAVSSRKYILTNTKLGNQSLRFYSSPVYANSQLLGVVLVGHPIDVIQSSLNKLSLALVATFLIMLLPTLLGGYF